MKNLNYLLLSAAFVFGLTSCEKEGESDEMDINFKTGTGFTYQDASFAGLSSIKIGIEAETEKAKDPIIKFNISESVNGSSNVTVYSQDVDDKEFEYDYSFILADTIHGNVHEYTFTVTNKDGMNEQKSLSITVE